MTRVRRLLWAVVVGLAAATGPAVCGDLQSWNGFAIKMLKSGPLEWSIDGSFRVSDHLSDIYDRRAGTQFSLDLGSGVSVGAGYLLRARDWPELERADWDHRATAGIDYPILPGVRSLKGMTLYERHIGQPGIRAFNRYRQQFEFDSERKRASPLLYQDFTFRREGFVRSRSRLGLRWRLQQGYTLKVAYQFESLRDGSAWRPRHAIYTEFEFDRTERGERP